MTQIFFISIQDLTGSIEGNFFISKFQRHTMYGCSILVTLSSQFMAKQQYLSVFTLLEMSFFFSSFAIGPYSSALQSFPISLLLLLLKIFLLTVTGHVDCLQELVTAGGKLEGMDLHFGTPLHAACFRESIQCAKVLLKAGTVQGPISWLCLPPNSVLTCIRRISVLAL